MDNNDELVKNLAFEIYQFEHDAYTPTMSYNQFIIRTEISDSYIKDATKIIRKQKLDRLFK